MLGDGGEVTAVVRVNGTVAKHSDPLKLADVKTGLEIKVAAASGVQCESTDTETAMITIKPGHHGRGSRPMEMLLLNDDNELVVDFLNIPEGVTVTVPSMMGSGTATAEQMRSE